MLSPSKGPNLANLAEMADRVGIATVAAAWPTGLAHLGVMVRTCEGCDATAVCSDWLARAPARIDDAPPFCPNAGALHAARHRS